MQESTGSPSSLQGHGEIKFGATKENPSPGHTGDAGKTSAYLSLKGPPGSRIPRSHHGSTLGRLDSTPRHPGPERVRKRQGSRAWCPRGNWHPSREPPSPQGEVTLLKAL